MKKKNNIRGFLVKIVAPAILSIVLFIGVFYFFFIPEFEKSIIERKRETIKELTNSAWSILEKCNQEISDSIEDSASAKKKASLLIGSLRYGEENKDYFWITDTIPVMINHPYKPELNGENLVDFSDSEGKKIFVEFVKLVKNSDQGYLDYTWQWKDDSTRIVPKVSYVKIFHPWGWIVGTGIYVEDVKEEISKIEKSLIVLSAIISGLIILLLVFTLFQSLRIEEKRFLAEEELKKSNQKYRNLVEAVTEGTMMILGKRIVYTNKALQELLGFSEAEIQKNWFGYILPDEIHDSEIFIAKIIELRRKEDKASFFLRKKDGELIKVAVSCSVTIIGNEQGYIIIVSDLSKGDFFREELVRSREQFEDLAGIINLGVFRSTLGRKSHLIEVNEAICNMLEYSKEDLTKLNIYELFSNRDERKSFNKNLTENKQVKDCIVRLNKSDGSPLFVSIACIIIEGENEAQSFCYGIIEDISLRKKQNEERDKLIVELQASLLYMSQPVRNLVSDFLTVDLYTSIVDTARKMTRRKTEFAMVTDNNNQIIGIVTDSDIRERVIAADNMISLESNIVSIMTSPVFSVPDSALLFETVLLMDEKKVRYVGVRNPDGNISGIVGSEEILRVNRYSSSYLIQQINISETVEELENIHFRLPYLIKSLIDSGANAKNITRTITAISDSIVTKIIDFAIQKIGEPPVKFAFIALGSEGREEQTLVTDQDNAIIYEDCSENHNEVSNYFLDLGKVISESMHRCGYEKCAGGIMAMNSKWNKPLSEWKSSFSEWMIRTEPNTIQEISLFFDYRKIYGDSHLVDELRSFVNDYVKGNDILFYNLSDSIIAIKPPLNMLGNIVYDVKSGDQNGFDIKKVLLIIVGFARIYATKYNIVQSNTIERLRLLNESDKIEKVLYNEIVHAYNYLMIIRFAHQAKMLNKGLKPDNIIPIDQITSIEESLLKKIFSRISAFQNKLGMDFKKRA